ncbi:MAG: PLP-dependent aminotransferase family protein [Actinobacteria bacterium]|nr:MAG: PLP-dependent aminotransferase family protein [Actinomycetota bacterium]
MEPISLARGVPAPECLALEELADCARAAIERDGATALNYGPAGGYAPLRDWIADRHRVEPERVVLTNGSLQGFRFFAELLSPTGTVIVEAPTYDRPLKILDELEAEVICIPLDEEPAVDGGAFLYTIPTFQNPTGRTLSRDRRKHLANLAKEALLVLEDDPYGLVRFDGKPEPTVFELARGENVVYSSSFSKTVAPGLRVGYLVLPVALADKVVAAATASYITPALLSQATVYEFLRRGNLEPNLERINGLLRARRDAMVSALERHLPEATWTVPEGGYFVWVELPPGILASDLRAEGVTFVPGSDFFCGPGGENAIRLAFSYESPSAIEEGVRRLASAVRAAIVLSRAA